MISIETSVVTPFQQNARLIVDKELKRAIVVDPGGEVEKILAPVLAGEFELEAALLTHCHVDHCGGVARLLKLSEQGRFKRPTVYGPNEEELRNSVAYQAAYFGLSPGEFENCPKPDVILTSRMKLNLLDLEWESRFTPGHSPEHYAYVCHDVEYHLRDVEAAKAGKGTLILAGDALFAGSIGRTDLPGGDHALLISTIRSELLTLPDESLVLPGHGPFTLIGVERRTNPFLQAGFGERFT